jgi:hypothetical protein
LAVVIAWNHLFPALRGVDELTGDALAEKLARPAADSRRARVP